MKSQLFDYKGCFGATQPDAASRSRRRRGTQALGQSNGASDPLTVEITTMTGGKVSGPITEHWTIAIGSLKGLIYYNTYTSAIAGMVSNSASNGAVMMLKPGQAAPTPLLAIAGAAPVGPCISCHSLSANGSMLVAQRHFYPGGLQSPGSMSFDLTKGLPNATNPVPLASNAMDDWGFSAVYPDGTFLLTAGESADSTMVTGLFPVANTNNPGMLGPKTNTMYNTSTGATITFTGLSDTHAMMPMFSPDGKKIVFNDVDNDGGHALVVEDFDKATYAFSNPVVIYKDPSNYPGWPFFTPDSANVVFAMGPGSNFASIPPASFSSVGPVQASASDVASSDLYMVRMSSPGKAQSLDLANGIKSGSSYLPFGSRDQHLNFYPTGSPVPAGGYFWVFFTSRRQYGNVMVDTTNNNAVPDPVFHAETKKIWATAIDHRRQRRHEPPGVLASGAGSRRAATSGRSRRWRRARRWASSCQSGVDCCGGYCYIRQMRPPAEVLGRRRQVHHERRLLRADPAPVVHRQCLQHRHPAIASPPALGARRVAPASRKDEPEPALRRANPLCGHLRRSVGDQLLSLRAALQLAQAATHCFPVREDVVGFYDLEGEAQLSDGGVASAGGVLGARADDRLVANLRASSAPTRRVRARPRQSAPAPSQGTMWSRSETVQAQRPTGVTTEDRRRRRDGPVDPGDGKSRRCTTGHGRWPRRLPPDHIRSGGHAPSHALAIAVLDRPGSEPYCFSRGRDEPPPRQPKGTLSCTASHAQACSSLAPPSPVRPAPRTAPRSRRCRNFLRPTEACRARTGRTSSTASASRRPRPGRRSSRAARRRACEATPIRFSSIRGRRTSCSSTLRSAASASTRSSAPSGAPNCVPQVPVDPKILADTSGMFDLLRADNPFKDWSWVYVPECTADFEWGSNVANYPAMGSSPAITVHHNGFVNVTAVRNWIYENFKSPDNIFVSGSSGGGDAALLHYSYLRQHYANVKNWVVLADSSFGVTTDQFLTTDLANWGSYANRPTFIPAIANASPSQLTQDFSEIEGFKYFPSGVVAEFGTSYDILESFTYQIMGGVQSDWHAKMEAHLQNVSSQNPNFRYLVAQGTNHIVLNQPDFYQYQVNGTSLRDWVANLADGQDVVSSQCMGNTCMIQPPPGSDAGP